MTGLIMFASVAAYVGGWMTASRILYKRWRPEREPIYCHHWNKCQEGNHHEFCYKRTIYSCSESESRAGALAAGLAWPVVLPLLGVAWVAFRDVKPSAPSVDAEISRLERELGMRP